MASTPALHMHAAWAWVLTGRQCMRREEHERPEVGGAGDTREGPPRARHPPPAAPAPVGHALAAQPAAPRAALPGQLRAAARAGTQAPAEAAAWHFPQQSFTCHDACTGSQQPAHAMVHAQALSTLVMPWCVHRASPSLARA
jgi:hypothetical protein